MVAGHPQCLHDYFLAAASRFADHIAVDVPPGDDRPRCTTTYAELAAMSASVATALVPLVRGECVVAILLPRDTAWLPAAQIGVMAAGAAYTCIDPESPDGHAEHVLRDSRPVALLCDRRQVERARRLYRGPVFDVGAFAVTAPAAWPDPPAWLGPRTLAYVIYTSGTTGWPKGVLIEHGGIANLIGSDLDRFALAPGARCAQGSSAAYDSSVEEAWLAFACGGTVVLLDECSSRLGPDLVPWLRRERIAVFCPPPTQLRLIGPVDVARELPDLRLLYVGGEALPQDLSDHWAGQCRLENGYGPTECSVTIVRATMRRGHAVHIGEPVSGNRALLLDAQLDEVAPGTTGELCIAGIALARGYLNQPELTAQRFVEHPHHGRIYRTGDLGVREADGTLRCLGRIDAQVKLHGHRIELSAIEAQLRACAGVRTAACALQGADVHPWLCGYVVADDPSRPPDLDELRRTLAQRLPQVMVPRALVLLDELPTTLGGKLDRKRLPAIELAAGADGEPPQGPFEVAIADAMAAVLRLQRVGRGDDFFALGGESVRAAELISRLRSGSGSGGNLTVRDIYERRTVAALAALAEARGQDGDVLPLPVGTRAGAPALAVLWQGAWIAIGYLCCGAAACAVAALLPVVLDGGPLWWAAAIAVVLAWPWLWLPFASLLAVGGKWLLIGRYRAGRHPVNGWFHLRHWLVQRLIALVPWSVLRGHVGQVTVLRWLGARIGRRVFVHRGVDFAGGGWDLLTIGDDVALGRDAALDLCRLQRGELVFAPVVLGAGATLATRAAVGPGATVGPGAELRPLAFLGAGASLPAGALADGVPAQPVGTAAANTTLAPVPGLAAGTFWRVMATLPEVLAVALPLLGAVLVHDLDVAALRRFVTAPWQGFDWRWLPWLGAMLPVRLLAQALVLRCSPRVPSGDHAIGSAAFAAFWQRTCLVESAGQWLVGGLYWPMWLRLCGARIGRGSELSTVLDTLPEQLTVGARSFFADGIYLTTGDVRAGHLRVAPIRTGSHVFLGNHAVLEPGTELPEHSLLGIATVAPAGIAAHTSWFGQPPFLLPRREQVDAGPGVFRPGAARIAERTAWEMLRLLLLPLIGWLGWLLVGAAAVAAGAAHGWPAAIALSAAAWLARDLALIALGIAAKWLLLGRVQPGQHSFWSSWCCRWEFFYMLWDRLALSRLAVFEGTPMLAPVLRLLGARIGRRVVLGPGHAAVVDPDMLDIGDGATVDGMVQAHTFEDRVLKIDRVRIGAGSQVGRGAVLLYGAQIGAGAEVTPHSVVMKQERLLPGRCYCGNPTREASSAG